MGAAAAAARNFIGCSLLGKGKHLLTPPRNDRKGGAGGGEVTSGLKKSLTKHPFRVFPTFRKSPNSHLNASLRVCSGWGEKLQKVWKGMQLDQILLPPEIHMTARGNAQVSPRLVNSDSVGPQTLRDPSGEPQCQPPRRTVPHPHPRVDGTKTFEPP